MTDLDEELKREKALSEVYATVMGERPRWSNNFGRSDALSKIRDEAA